MSVFKVWGTCLSHFSRMYFGHLSSSHNNLCVCFFGQDFIDDQCMTPDCYGLITNIQIFDSSGLKTEVGFLLSLVGDIDLASSFYVVLIL